MAGQPVPMITAAPQFQLPHGGRNPFDDGLVKRQDLTFGTCGLECATDHFCQAYRTSYGFCCPTTILTRTQFNYCAPATTCIDFGVSSVSDYFYDSTRSIQYCGQDRPNCATYIFTNDDFTQIFCASSQTGRLFFDTTSTAGQSATFIGGPTLSSARTTSTSAQTGPSAIVVSRTTSARSFSTGGSTSTSSQTTTAASTSAPASSDGALGTGAVAGIAVGAALGGVGLAIAAFFFWRRSSGKRLGSSSSGSNQFPPQPPDVQMAHAQYAQQPGYYQSQQPYAPVAGSGTELAGHPGEHFKPQNPPQGTPVFELGGGGGPGGPPGGAQLPYSPYHENAAPQFAGRQELQG